MDTNPDFAPILDKRELSIAFAVSDADCDDSIALKLLRSRFERVANSIPGLVFQWILRRDDTIDCTYLSGAGEEPFGLSIDEMCEDTTRLLALIHTDDRDSFFSAMRLSRETLMPFDWIGRMTHAVTHIPRQWRITARPEAYPDGDVAWDGVIFDTSEAHDALTGLPNRARFLEELELSLQMVARDERNLSVLFLDVDGFKRVNDLWGHAAGDQLLVQVARRLTGVLRTNDFVARLGGDEFIGLLTDVHSYDEPYQVAARIVEAFQQPILADGNEVYITVSVGVAVYPFDGRDAHALMRAADTAMYEAKNAGRNMFQMHTRQMQVATEERLVLEEGLRRAIDREELSMVYQPIVSLRTGLPTGVEALMRWNHSSMGLVPCSRFIPVAEESGLIRPLGEWAIRDACRQAAEWMRERSKTSMHSPIGVAVNLSARQLGLPGLVEQITRALDDYGLNAYFLELELTESALIWNGDGALKTLKALKNLGIRLAVDDFGSGYSSLEYLRRFPFDAVKIDRSFVAELHDPQTNAIVRAVIDLAHALNLSVVAEGVEQPEQRDMLYGFGCDAIQGWLFSRPLPANEVTALFK